MNLNNLVWIQIFLTIITIISVWMNASLITQQPRQLDNLDIYRQAMLEVFVPDPTVEKHIYRNINLKSKEKN